MSLTFQFKNDLVYQIIRERILSGDYPQGMKLPPEPDFARDLQVGKVTLRSALARLEHERLIVRMRSKGTFITSPAPTTVNKLAIVMNQTVEAGSPMPYLLSLLLKAADRRGIAMEQIELLLAENLPVKMLRKIFQEKQIDGILLMTSNFTGEEAVVDKLKALKLPVVLPHGEMGDSLRTGFASVVIDERRAFGETIRRMLESPCAHIVILGRETEGYRLARGFTTAELEGALDGRLHSIVYASYDLADIARLVDRLYTAEGPKPDAFICFSDLYAIFLSIVLKERGLRIPEDVSVMGFSGMCCDFQVMVELTGVKYRYEAMINSALDLMLRHKEWFSPDYPPSTPVVVEEFDFTIGKSVATAAKATIKSDFTGFSAAEAPALSSEKATTPIAKTF